MTLAAPGHRAVRGKGRLRMPVALKAKIVEARLDTHF